MEAITFEQMPAAICRLNDKLDRLESLLVNLSVPSPSTLPKYVDIKGAADITSKTPNALRVQISCGNLKSIKRGSRHYFERDYLEKWISGETAETKKS
ncbi:MAG: hypothetical protein EOO20_27780 [Chryseobacterium sp.]|nr:MAG: hypothetical protein EOO20_27780 [Chryseobacterium sp.]